MAHLLSPRRIVKYFSLGFLSFLLASTQANAQGVSLPTNVGLPSGSLAGVIANFTYWLLGIFGFIAVIGFVISGIMYFLAAGDENAQEKAKRQMVWSITGVIVGLLGLVVVYAVDALLRGSKTF